MRPLGPLVDDEPRRRPEPQLFRGHYVTLEPAELGHRAELWRSQQACDPAALSDSFAYLSYGPFKSEAAFNHWFGGFSAREDHRVWVVRPAQGEAAGWVTLMDIQPGHASIELGNIWLAPSLQRSRAATEAFYLAMSYALDQLAYRRLSWKCNALNAPSRRAALRLGLVFEGVWRNHMIVKGRARDSAYYSMIIEEWPDAAQALQRWLAAENFTATGAQVSRLEDLRAAITGRPAPAAASQG